MVHPFDEVTWQHLAQLSIMPTSPLFPHIHSRVTLCSQNIYVIICCNVNGMKELTDVYH